MKTLENLVVEATKSENRADIIKNGFESGFINDLLPCYTEYLFKKNHSEIFYYLNRTSFDFSNIYCDADNILKAYIIQKAVYK